MHEKDITFHILVRLFENSDGFNQYQLMNHMPTSQEYKRFSNLLEKMCVMEIIERKSADHIRKGQSFFIITEQGKQTVRKIREYRKDPTMRAFVPEEPSEVDTQT